MIIYNVTIKIDSSIADEWLRWIQDEHIPDMINSGCFTDYKLLKLLETDESDGLTYAVQYFADDMTSYQRYIETYAPGMRGKNFDKWGDKFIAIRSVMEVVN